MHYLITDIEFDFSSAIDGEFSEHYYDNLTNSTIGSAWEADNKKDLKHAVSCATQWPVKKIKCRNYPQHLIDP